MIVILLHIGMYLIVLVCALMDISRMFKIVPNVIHLVRYAQIPPIHVHNVRPLTFYQLINVLALVLLDSLDMLLRGYVWIVLLIVLLLLSLWPYLKLNY